MARLSNIGEALETLSGYLGTIPFMLYAAAAVLFLVGVISYVFVIPKRKTRKKAYYRKICAGGMLILYVLLLAAILFAGKHTVVADGSRLVQIVLAVAGFVALLPVGVLFQATFGGKYQAASAAVTALALAGITYLQNKTFVMLPATGMVSGALLGVALALCWHLAFAKKGAAFYALRTLLVLIVVCLCAGSGAFGAYHILRTSGQDSMEENISAVENQMKSRNTDGSDAKVSSDPDIVWYNGKAYRYNKNIMTMLIMGIDQNSEEIEQKEDVSGESGQADTIFLMVMDREKKNIKMISISRDTMTDIKTFDYKGNYLGNTTNHLGLAYAFGDGKTTSCQYMVDAVSNLFYGMPINAYVTLNMNAVAGINDAVGGVTVTIPEDLTSVNPAFVKDAQVHLEGDQALQFMRFRNTEEDFSNDSRMERQKQYMVNFMTQAVAAVKADMGLPLSLYQSLSGDMVTNISADRAVYLVTEALSMHLDADGITSLKAKSKKGSVYDEVYVDDDALYDLIIQTFYKEEMTEGETE